MGCNPLKSATPAGVHLRLDRPWPRRADQERRPNTVPAGAEKAPRLHEEEHPAETFTPDACSSWMNSPMFAWNVRWLIPSADILSQFRFVMVARPAFPFGGGFCGGEDPIGVATSSGYHMAMNLILLMVVLLLLFGGGGFYFGGPAIGGGGVGLIILICLIIFFMGGFRTKE